jgi:hypothetical protein
MTCVNPVNQPIYQALLDKAASYPADKVYQAKAYQTVAESVLNHTWDINEIARQNQWWKGQGRYIPGNGDSTREFITDFVKMNSPPPEISPAFTAAVKAVIARIDRTSPSTSTTHQNVKVKSSKPTLRRSERIKAKPLIKYA